MAEPITDLELAVQTLLGKTQRYNILWDYYQGRQPLVYSFDRLRDIFKHFDARFSQNWCAVVVDTVMDRITLQRITIADNENATKQLSELLAASSLMLEARSVHLAADVTGESFVIVWPDEETGKPEAYYNDPRTVHLFYEADKPRAKRFAVKWWLGDDGYRYVTLYYADRLEYYRSRKQVYKMGSGMASYNEVTGAKSFDPYEGGSEANPFDIVPVFHFRRDRRVISSELQDIIEPQDAVNKLIADMMVAAEFGAFPQRWIISQAEPSMLKNSPSEIWALQGSDKESQPVSVGQFEAAQLTSYIDAVDKWTNYIAIRSRTPKHYFFGQGGDPSGEALIAMEAPLNHKAQTYIDNFTEPWTEVAQFVAKLGGMGDIADDAIIPVFDKPQTVQPYTQALIRKEGVAAGLPIMWLMKQEGYTEQELDELDAAVTEKATQDMDRMAQVMEQRTSNFQQNGNKPQQNGQPQRAPTGGRNSA